MLFNFNNNMIGNILSKLGNIVHSITHFIHHSANNIWINLYHYISIFILYCVITLKKGTGIVFVNAITNDSIFSALEFFADITKENYYSQKYLNTFIDSTKLRTNMGLIERYIYYLFLEIVSFSLSILLWDNGKFITYLLLISATHPYIMQYLCSISPLVNIMSFLNKKINKIIKYSVLSAYSYCFNNICKNILDRNPAISAGELSIFYKKRSCVHLIDFLKILIISLVIQYMESVGSIYTKLVKALYNYGALIEIRSEHYEHDKYAHIVDPRKKIIAIISKRDWNLFFNAKILKIIIQLYRDNKKESLIDKINKGVKYGEIIIGKIFAFYSISVLFDNPLISVILSIILCYIGKFESKYYYPRIFSLLLWVFKCNIIYVTIISESFELFFNDITYFILHKIAEKINENRYLLVHENKYNLNIITISFLAYMLRNIPNSPIISALIVATNKHLYIALYIYIFGFFSHYNPLQLLLNALILYIAINIYDHKSTPKQTLNLNIINSYVNKVKINNVNDSVIVEKYPDIINVEQHNIYSTEDLHKSFLNSSIIVPKNSNLIKSFDEYKENKKKGIN
ncbi:hypothetical protein Catovirus_1_792 [Catovirus CTV1]|uniref:Uncharacterized protein n=1 Tax=Catovirus CTV1 TaxID=1977631 RepID=A0A1V0SAK6_9VIRU|nr:hypothetical protein Catovirus_1_792 [Catovirus CTV1]